MKEVHTEGKLALDNILEDMKGLEDDAAKGSIPSALALAKFDQLKCAVRSKPDKVIKTLVRVYKVSEEMAWDFLHKWVTPGAQEDENG